MTQADTAPAGPLPAPRTWLGPALVLTGGLFVGLAPIGLRLGLDTLGPQAIAFWRFLFATPIILLALIIHKKRLPARPNPAIIVAGLCFGLDIALWHWGLARTTVANATFIVNLGNIGVGLLAWLVLKERPTLRWAIAVAIAVTGAAGLSLGGPAGGQADLVGDLLSLGAAIAVSAYMLFSKMARLSLSAIDALFWLTFVETVFILPILLASGERLIPETVMGFAAPLFLALGVQIAGQGCIIAGLGRTPAAIAGVLVLVQPVTAAAISWHLFDEPLNTVQVFGASLILLGVYLAQRSGRLRVGRPVSEPSHS